MGFLNQLWNIEYLITIIDYQINKIYSIIHHLFEELYLYKQLILLFINYINNIPLNC